MLIGTVCDRLGSDKGKIPTNDESLNNPTPTVSYLVEESLIKGTFKSVLGCTSNVKKYNWSTIMIFPSWGNHIVRNIVDVTTFITYVQFLPSKRLYSSGRSFTSTSMVTFW